MGQSILSFILGADEAEARVRQLDYVQLERSFTRALRKAQPQQQLESSTTRLSDEDLKLLVEKLLPLFPHVEESVTTSNHHLDVDEYSFVVRGGDKEIVLSGNSNNLFHEAELLRKVAETETKFVQLRGEDGRTLLVLPDTAAELAGQLMTLVSTWRCLSFADNEEDEDEREYQLRVAAKMLGKWLREDEVKRVLREAAECSELNYRLAQSAGRISGSTKGD